MIRIEEIQSIGAFTMAVFAMAVALSPRRKVMGKEKEYNIMKRSRWMLFSALIILSVHYVLQRTFGFRHMGELQGSLLNFLLYTPSVLLMNLTMLNILRFGKIKRWEYSLGIAVSATQIAAFAIAGTVSDKGVFTDSTELMVAEYLSSAIAMVMLIVYIMITRREYKKIKDSLDQYYDQPQQEMIQWFATSMTLFMLLALTTPIMIYSQHLMLMAYGMIMFAAIAFLVINFLHYSSSNYMQMIMAAEVPEQSDAIATGALTAEMTKEEKDIMQKKVAAWLATRSYLRNGITMAEVSQEMGVSRQDISRYLRTLNYSKIGSWLAELRIEEAKRLILENENFSNEAIAISCGFSSREYFQSTFRNLVGMTPKQWQSQK